MIEVHEFYGPSHWPWVTARIPMKRVEDTCGLMAICSETNEAKGAIIFDNFLNNSCQATIILDTPMLLRHGFLEQAFERIFGDLGKEYVYALIAENNQKSLRFCGNLGFVEKFRIPDGYSEGVDFIVHELAREDCAFYQKMRVN